MKQIYLVCNLAMSTGIMCNKLNKEAEKRNLDYTFEAKPLSELNKFVGNADMILTSPQIQFAIPTVKQAMGDKPVEPMSIQDFGLMNAPAVMDVVVKRLG